jgi:hypothetical protein
MRAALQQHEDRHAAMMKDLKAKDAEIEGLREYIRQHEEPPGEQGQARKRK